MIRVSTVFQPADGSTAAQVEGATVAIYNSEVGGSPLWQETLNLTRGADGRYTALIGSTTNEGIPVGLFTAVEPRWLGIQFNRAGEVEQARVQLASVPYALRATDAETLGGHPASDYQLAPAAAATTSGNSGETASTDATLPAKNGKVGARVTSGTAGYIAQFVNSTDLGNSNIFQNGSGFVGIGTTVPGTALDVQSATAGFTTLLNLRQTNSAGSGATGMTMTNQNAQMLMRAYTPGAPGLLSNSIGWFALNGSNKLFIGHAGGSVGNDVQFFTNNQWNNPQVTLTQAGNLGIGTTTPAYKLDLAGDMNFTGVIRYAGGVAVQFVPASLTTSVGNNALLSNTTGLEATAFGDSALRANTTGNANTGIGGAALTANTSGSLNTAVGAGALPANTTASGNTAAGALALNKNTTGPNNTAVGYNALNSNTEGFSNTAAGVNALTANVDGTTNTALGATSLSTNTHGNSNSAVGANSLALNVTGNGNTAVGEESLYRSTGNNNTALGAGAAGLQSGGGYTTGGNNIAIGVAAAKNVNGNNSNNIHIGSQGSGGDSGTIRIGGAIALGDPAAQTAFFASGIRGVTTANNDALTVVIDSAGQLGTVSSSRRFKEDIQDMGTASAGLMNLRPVTFRYKKPFADGSKPVQYGLIAEEVAEVYPDLVAHSADGQIESVKYQVLDSMLLNEVQRQEKVIQQQESEIEALKAKLNALSALEARITALESAPANR